MQDTEIKFAPDGTLTFPDVHDGLLLGLLATTSDEVFVVVRTTKKEVIGLCFEGVDRLRADNFRKGNIILDIVCKTGNEVNPDDIRHVYDAGPSYDEFIGRTAEDFKRTGKLFVQVSASYGCELQCVCKNIVLANNWLDKIAHCQN